MMLDEVDCARSWTIKMGIMANDLGGSNNDAG
jgi:hypothetical protein